MRNSPRPRLLHLIFTLGIFTALCTPSLAGEIALLSIGPRIGFGEKVPLMGKEQKYYFHLTDVAAVIKLPWSWPLGESTWSLETRLIASAGLLTAANESGLMMTAVPDLALSGWDLSPSTPELGQDSSATTSLACKISGVQFKSLRPWGFASIHFSTPIPAFVSNTSPMPACMDRPSLGVDMYIVELGYRL